MRILLVVSTLWFYLMGGVDFFSGRSSPTSDEVTSDLVLDRLVADRRALWWVAKNETPTPAVIIERTRLLIRYRTTRIDHALIINAEAISQATDRLRRYEAASSRRPTWFTGRLRWEPTQKMPVGWTRG